MTRIAVFCTRRRSESQESRQRSLIGSMRRARSLRWRLWSSNQAKAPSPFREEVFWALKTLLNQNSSVYSATSLIFVRYACRL